MQQIYKSNILLWMEDDKDQMDSYALSFGNDEKITEIFRGELNYIFSNIEQKVDTEIAKKEIENLIEKSNNNPSLINLRDSNFPINGAKIMEWLSEHGFPDYPLTGFSGTAYANLPPEYQEIFATTSARYFTKSRKESDQMKDHVILSKMYNDRKYLNKH